MGSGRPAAKRRATDLRTARLGEKGEVCFRDLMGGEGRGGERLQSPFRVISSIHYFLWRYHAVYGKSKVSTAICHCQSPSLDV